MHLFGWWLVPSCYIQIQAVSVVSPLIYVVTCICCLIQPKMPTSSNNDLKTSTCSKLLTWWFYMLMFLTKIFAMCLISNSECMSQHKWGGYTSSSGWNQLQHQYMHLNQPLATYELKSSSRATSQQFKKNTHLPLSPTNNSKNWLSGNTCGQCLRLTLTSTNEIPIGPTCLDWE